MKKVLLLITAGVLLMSCGKEDDDKKTIDNPNTGNSNKAEWLQDAFSTIISDNDINAISYWNENWEDVKPVNMVINSSQKALDVYTQNISNNHFKVTPNIANGKVLAPATGAYHSAYPGFSINNGSDELVTAEKISEFVTNATKDIAWVYFSNSWHKGIKFPKTEVELIHSQGKVPFVRMMAWSEIAPHLTQADPVYTMQKFIDGDFDTDLKQWAQDLKAFGKPTMIEFGTEVDGNFMPWNGQWNGADEMSYGDNTLPDGAERFRDAYRHIIDLFKAEGVTNATWVFHVNYSPTPEEEWNNMKYYYPGDSYIDWLGVSIYGPIYEGYVDQYSFTEIWNYVKPSLKGVSSSKPIAILELGVGEF